MKRVAQRGIPDTQVCITVGWGFQIICPLSKHFCRSFCCAEENKSRELIHCANPPQSLRLFFYAGDMCVWEDQSFPPKWLPGLGTPSCSSECDSSLHHILQSSLSHRAGHRDRARPASWGHTSNRDQVFPGSPAWSGWEESLAFLTSHPAHPDCPQQGSHDQSGTVLGAFPPHSW